METLNQLIDLTTKKLSLLRELKEAMLSEKADYIIDQTKMSRCTSSDYNYYFVIKRITGDIVFSGNKSQVEKYLIKRKIVNTYWRRRTLTFKSYPLWIY